MRHVVQIMEATTGGTRRHMVDLVNHLDRTQFEVSVICSNLRDDEFNRDINHFRANGITVHLVPMAREISLSRDWRAFRALSALFREHRYDIIHAQSTKAGVLARWAAHLSGSRAKLVYTPHVFAFLMRVTPFQRWAYVATERLTARFTDHLIAVSETDVQAALDHGLFKPDAITCIPNGICPDRFQNLRSRAEARNVLKLAPEAFVVGTVGRLTQQKGQRYLLEAVPRILEAAPNAQFVFIGAGEDLPDLERLVQTLGLSSAVRFAGGREDVESLYPAMDIFVLPSLWEGCPYTLQEAMYSRLPVVATDIMGTREVIPSGQTGILVPPADPAALGKAILHLVRDPGLRASMSAAGRRRVEEHYTVQEMVDRTEDVYRAVLGDD